MTLIIAHRGFSGNYPENTLLAIRKAIELGVDGIEIDAWHTTDHRVVVIHDPKLNRMTNGKGRVAWKSFDELSKYTVDGSNQRIPCLEEVLDLIKKSKVKLNIELKSVLAAHLTVDLIKDYGMENQVMISSAKIRALRIVKKELPELKTAYLFFLSNNLRWGAFVTLWAKLFFKITHRIVLGIAKSLEVDYVHPSYPFIVNSFVKKLHKRGYKVNVWVVNTKPLMKKLIRRNVDGIITNYPDKLKEVIDEMKKTK